MDILLWLVPPAAVTLLAMVWAAWAGRPRLPDGARTERSEADRARFAAAILREHPAAGKPRPPVVRDRSNGIAVRPSRRTPPADRPEARRSA